MDTVKNKTKRPHKNYREEAMRYVENARECLLKAGKDGDYYSDPKYVKMAGNALWNGVLLALKAKIPVKGRPDIIKYRQEVGKTNRKLLNTLNAAYDTCHLAMGYDGNISVTVCTAGMKYAVELIEWAAPE
jgi:hypothetical protein